MNTVPLPLRDNKPSPSNDSSVQLMSVVVDKTVDRSISDLILDDLKKLGKDKCPSAEYLNELQNKYNTEIILRCDSSDEDSSDVNVLLSYSIGSNNSGSSTTINVNTTASSNNSGDSVEVTTNIIDTTVPSYTSSGSQGSINITVPQNTGTSSVSSTSPTFNPSTESNSPASTSSFSSSGGSGGSGVAKTIKDVVEDTKRIHENWKKSMQNKEPRYHFIDGMGVSSVKELSVLKYIKALSNLYEQENKKNYPGVTTITQERAAAAILAVLEGSNSFNWADANGKPISTVLKRVSTQLPGVNKSLSNDEDIKTALD